MYRKIKLCFCLKWIHCFYFVTTKCLYFHCSCNKRKKNLVVKATNSFSIRTVSINHPANRACKILTLRDTTTLKKMFSGSGCGKGRREGGGERWKVWFMRTRRRGLSHKGCQGHTIYSSLAPFLVLVSPLESGEQILCLWTCVQSENGGDFMLQFWVLLM